MAWYTRLDSFPNWEDESCARVSGERGLAWLIAKQRKMTKSYRMGCIVPGFIECAEARNGRFVGMGYGLLLKSESRRWTRPAEKGGGYF